MEAMQRLALMMAVMILGAPQVYGCHASGDLRVQGVFSLSDPAVCPMITPGKKVKTRMRGEPLDAGD
jgi:hypothetical protein